ncbi:MFS transporter [Methanosphaera sp. WGK6]|uniref:MFS transporter n=1 Tax=Methanosphaera sp. WGK6 TaxID=1561964 RepID=UPI00084C67A4|nr:MFS transporter [Methanosphaera sp. WGK6]OED29917.1 hypothetical protein NL43_05780 [Methanosphaera sp. WGK6]
MKQYNQIILLMVLGTFGILSTELGIIGILPQIAQHFNITIDQAGLFVSVFAIIIAITSIFIPLLVSNLNRKWLFSSVLLVFAITSLISGFTTNFYIGLLCRIIPAIIYPAYCSLTFAVVEEIAPPSEVQMGISKVLMGVSAGSIIGVPITTFFATTIGYTAAMIWFAIINIIAAIATMIFFPDMKGTVMTHSSQIKSAKTKLFYLSCLGIVILVTGVCISYSYMSEFLQSVTQIYDTTLTLTLFLFGIASLIGTWTGGKLLTKSPDKTVVIYPVLFSIILLMLYIYGHVTIPTIIFMILWGAFDGVLNNIMQYWVVSAAPQAPEFANGMYFSMLNIGITIGTSIGGVLIMNYGTMSIFIGSVIILLFSDIFLYMRVRLYENII